MVWAIAIRIVKVAKGDRIICKRGGECFFQEPTITLSVRIASHITDWNSFFFLYASVLGIYHSGGK
jgi:hypothetical protein